MILGTLDPRAFGSFVRRGDLSKVSFWHVRNMRSELACVALEEQLQLLDPETKE